MFAVVIRESSEPASIEDSKKFLEANVVPKVRQGEAVAAFWMTDGEGKTLNVLAYDNEQSARGALERVRQAPRPESVTLESADLYEVLAQFGI